MCDEILDMTIRMIGEFCDTYIDDEFKALCVKLAYELADTEGISFEDDTAENWACGIIYAIGQMNFLFDFQIKPYIDQDSLCHYFSAKRQKMTAKSRDIRRILNLKLGNNEFSSEFVLSLNIPESDADLKRIRQFDEVKYLISQKCPEDAYSVDNSELERLIDEAMDGSEKDELYMLLRSTYFIRPYSGNMGVTIREGSKFIIPVFLGIEECRILEGRIDDLKLRPWPFFNANAYLDNDDFEGILVDGCFLIAKDIIRRVYPNPDMIDYSQIFFHA